jgi:hypothetical protein
VLIHVFQKVGSFSGHVEYSGVIRVVCMK